MVHSSDMPAGLRLQAQGVNVGGERGQDENKGKGKTEENGGNPTKKTLGRGG